MKIEGLLRFRKDSGAVDRTRDFQIEPAGGAGAPRTLDLEARTVGMVLASEEPVLEYDPEWGRAVPETLLMSGFRRVYQVALVDTHDRYDLEKVLGSVRDLKVIGRELVGVAHYHDKGRGDLAFSLVAGGHLTDYSAGFVIHAVQRIMEGETVEVNGKAVAGPARLVTDWSLLEASQCVRGADPTAKVRNHKPRGDSATMDEKTRALLVALGLIAEGATDEEALRVFEGLDREAIRAKVAELAAPAEAGQANQGDRVRTHVSGQAADGEAFGALVERLERALSSAERMVAVNREAEEVREMGRTYGLPDVAERCVKEGKTRAEAAEVFLRELSAGERAIGGAHVMMGADAREKFRAAAEDAVLVRAGIPVKTPAAGHDELLGYGLRDLAREFVVRSGQRLPRYDIEMIGRALSTDDFQYLLGSIPNRSLLEGYESVPEQWEECFATGSLPDFRPATLVRAGETDDLDQIPEGGEYRYGARAEHAEMTRMETYGKMMLITRQAIQNDDLAAITDIPFQHGASARRKVGDLPFAVLEANRKMGDAKPLFDAAHGNIATPAAPGFDALNEMDTLLGLQKDLGKKRFINIPAQCVIAPRSLKGLLETFFQSPKIGTAEKPEQVNIWADSLKRIYEARLDGYSKLAYYLAGPKHLTVKVFFLQGRREPWLEQKEGWTVDGTEFKVRIDAVAKAVDWRGIIYNAGSA